MEKKGGRGHSNSGEVGNEASLRKAVRISRGIMSKKSADLTGEKGLSLFCLKRGEPLLAGEARKKDELLSKRRAPRQGKY